MDYDPFRVMQERDLKYGFTIALREYRATIPSLWKNTLDFAKSHPQYIYPRTRPDSLLGLISDDNGWSYNLCHFWSNFEVNTFCLYKCKKSNINQHEICLHYLDCIRKIYAIGRLSSLLQILR